jgi:protein-S-isoprenylcysteine O-methyltransferase Ste14
LAEFGGEYRRYVDTVRGFIPRWDRLIGTKAQ